jgi:2-octaprenyl-6-methoxyphenol hydroxylase
MENKIIIFGCGISGMLTALALAKESIESIIIDIKSDEQLEHPDDPRTTALNSSSLDFMSEIDVLSDLNCHLEAIRDIYVCQNMKDNIFHMKGNGQELGYMIENISFRKILYQQTAKNKFIKIKTQSRYQNIELEDRRVKFDLLFENKKEEISTNLCIAADGRFSEVKKLFFKNRMFKDYNQKAIVFNISHDIGHDGGAIEHFLPRGSFATLPLKGGKSSGIVWVEKTDIADFYLKQPNEVLEEQISKFIGGSLGNIKIISKPTSFPLGAFFSESYFNSRIVLVADSAHSMHPLAGQGLNMGIKDVKALSELIVKNNSLGLDYDQIMLEKYERMRKIDNIAMVRITDNINRIFTSNSKILNKITSLGLGAIDRIPILQDILVNYAKGAR